MIPKYDKSKCTATPKLFQGYTGCMCPYCVSYKNLKGRWQIGVHKGYGNEYEIFVARENNRHGFASWGWTDKNKYIIQSGVLDKNAVPIIKELARTLADKLNKKDQE